MYKLTKSLVVILAVSSLTVPVMASSIRLNINGTAVKTTVAPYQSSGTTLVPLRVVSENLGANVGWNQKEQKLLSIKELQQLT